jgi:uncharacterized protein (TIGR04255 family)
VALHFPELDRKRLARAPLTSVVCQVRFDQTAQVSEAKTARAFHEALGGRAGPYPKLESITETQVNLAFGPGVLPGFGHQSGAMSGWRLTNEDGTRAIGLMPHSLAFEDRQYATWDDDFAPRLDAALAALREHVDPVFEQRLGLRYINQITEPDVREAEGWRGWIDGALLGIVMHDEIGPHVKLARQQVVLELENDVRCTLNHGFAPDPERDAALTYLVDIDVSREGMRPFDRDAISAAAAEFNAHALGLFQSTVTRELRERLSRP